MQLGTDRASVKSFSEFLGFGSVASFSISSVEADNGVALVAVVDGLTTVVVLLVVGRRSNRSDGDRCCVDLIVGRCCGCCCCDVVLRCRLWCREDLHSQVRSRSRLQGHLVAVVAVVRLGRLRLGCPVVVGVGLFAPDPGPMTNTMIETGLDQSLCVFDQGKELNGKKK